MILSQPRVLVVDDHDDSRTVARMVLEHAGYRVSEAATGPEGLQSALDEQPDVALVDIALPEFDGLELARRIRANTQTCETRIVAVSAMGREDLREASYLAGCDAFLAKPFYIATLRRVVCDQLREARNSSVDRLVDTTDALQALAGR